MLFGSSLQNCGQVLGVSSDNDTNFDGAEYANEETQLEDGIMYKKEISDTHSEGN